MKEEIIKTIKTKKGAKVSLVKPAEGLPFFRYHAGSSALIDNFHYIIKQHGMSDTAKVTVDVELPASNDGPQRQFNEELDSFFSCLEFFMDGSKGTLALTNLLGIDEGVPLNDDWIEDVFDGFTEVFPPADNGKFDFEERIGEYHFVIKEGVWKQEKSNSKLINIYFPSSPEQKENDVLLTIENYEYKEVKIIHEDNEIYYLPVSFASELYIGKERYFAAYLNGKNSRIPTEYHPYGLPISGELQLYVNPYDISLQVTHQVNKQKGLDLSVYFIIQDRGKCKLGIDSVVSLAHDDFDNLESDQIKFPTGNLIVNGITFTNLGSLYEAGIKELATQEEIDKILDVGVEMDGKRIGKVRVILDSPVDIDKDGRADIEVDVVVEFNEGTTQSIRDKFIKHFDEYFSNTKPDGTPRNDAFNYRGSASYKTSEAPPVNMKEAELRAADSMLSGFRKRFSRKPIDNKKRAETLKGFFMGENQPEVKETKTTKTTTKKKTTKGK